MSNATKKNIKGDLPSSGESHRTLRKGLISAVDLHPSEGIAQDENIRPWGNPIDLGCIIRFPPGVAGLLRKRITLDFEKLSGLNTSAEAGPMGLRITPTLAEDCRLFNIEVDLFNEDDVKLIETWHPNVCVEENAMVSSAGASIPNYPEIQYTLKLFGLLTELPSILEAYKSLDQDLLYKSMNISQLLVVFFPEDEMHTFTADVTSKQDHTCLEQYTTNIEKRSELDTQVFALPRCPWLWPSGITPPLRMHREERHRDFCVVSRAEIRACEMIMLSILKRGRMEWAEIDVNSQLEAFMLEEAMKPQTTVPNAQTLLNPTSEQKIVYIVGEQETTVFNDPPSDFSDVMFGDDHNLDERQLLEDRTYGTNQNKRRKDKRNAEDGSRISATDAQDEIGRNQLEQEFNKLAENKVRQTMEAELEAEIEDDFYSRTVLEEQD